jgi:hypothetical protein
MSDAPEYSARECYLREVARELLHHAAALHPALPATSPMSVLGDGICRQIAVCNALQALDCFALGSANAYRDLVMDVAALGAAGHG